MKYKLEIGQGWANNDWYWHVRHRNGKVLAQGEGYRRRGDLLTMLGRLFKGTQIADQVEELRRKK